VRRVTDNFMATRAVVADPPGEPTTLTLYTDDGAVASITLGPADAVGIASDLLSAARRPGAVLWSQHDFGRRTGARVGARMGAKPQALSPRAKVSPRLVHAASGSRQSSRIVRTAWFLPVS
jgi:hypothetical protein